jgi:hypothetical protein
MSDVRPLKGEVLRAVLDAWREVPDGWSLGKLVANASMIAHGGVVDLREVDDDVLMAGLRALVPDPFEEDPRVIIDDYARKWEKENGVFNG